MPGSDSDLVISADRLSKAYRIGVPEQGDTTLIGSALSLLKAPLKGYRAIRDLDTTRIPPAQADDDPGLIWALRDVSFEVRRGQVLGIVGRNGAGKSTLLKLLSRVASPTAGRVSVSGRLAALLEVGTGFHPDLTGRENIYLNGAILGMTRREIGRKFDEIVAFSGVGRFLDTPVKRFSSGMRVRLGFAVAAHLEPDILVVDEVLAVGDAEFQQKCLGRMHEVAAQEGRTVLFVSHNLNAMSRLCDRCLLIEGGRLVSEGPPRAILSRYLERQGSDRGPFRVEPDPGRDGMVLEVSARDPDDRPVRGELDGSRPFAVEIVAWSASRRPSAYLTLSLRDPMGTPVLFTDLRDTAAPGITPGLSRYRVEFPPWLLAPMDYYVTVGLADGLGHSLDVVENRIRLTIRDFDSARGGKRLGYIGARLPWRLVDGDATRVTAPAAVGRLGVAGREVAGP